MIGVAVRPVSAILAALALAEYVTLAAPRAVWPIRNDDIEALLYFVVFVYFAVAGPGAGCLSRAPWSANRHGAAASSRNASLRSPDRAAVASPSCRNACAGSHYRRRRCRAR